MADDLFKQGSQEQVPMTSVMPKLAWAVTNHLNLFYMVGAGLLMPPAGFGRKYYQDTLGTSPGHIPLFLDKKIPAGTLALSTVEAAHLRPVILELDLAGLHVPHAEPGVPWSWLPAPLPSTRVKRILFASDADKRATEADAKDYGNVSLADFRRSVNKRAFTRTSGAHWPPTEVPAQRNVPLHAPFATGAVAALFLHLGNRGELSMRACSAAFDPADAASIAEPPLNTLAMWARTGNGTMLSSDGAGESRPEPHERLFWGVVDRLVEWRGAGDSLNGEDVVLSYLETELETFDQRDKAGAKELFDTLMSLTGLGAPTVSELFSRHRTPLARSMILFFLRETCSDLLDFDHDETTEVDWLAAAILFGVREGWLGVPAKLRDVAGLGAAVADRMASLSHRMAGTDFDLGVPSPRPRPLRELFDTQHDWSPKQDQAAQDLVRELGWDCAETRIDLGHGTYRFVIGRGGARIETPIEPKITRIVDKGRFLGFLATKAIRASVERRIRRRLAASSRT